MALPLITPGPLAFIPPPVAIGAANAIVPFVLPSAVGTAAAVTAAAAGAPVVAALVGGVALGALIGYGLSQWGQVNGPDRDALGTEVADPLQGSGSYVKGGTSADGRDFAVGVYSHGIYGPDGWVSGFSIQNQVLPRPNGTNFIPSSLAWNTQYPYPNSPSTPAPPQGPGFRGYLEEAESASGSIQTFGNTTFSGYFPTSLYSLRWVLISNTTGGEVVNFNQPEPLPWLNPAELPEPTALDAETLPAVVPPAPLILPIAPVPGSTRLSQNRQPCQIPRAPPAGQQPRRLLSLRPCRGPLPPPGFSRTPQRPRDQCRASFPATQPSQPSQLLQMARSPQPSRAQ